MNIENKTSTEEFNRERYGEEGLKLKKKYERLIDTAGIEEIPYFDKFALKLIEKYGKEKCHNYIAFHILIRSTPGSNSENYKFDFEGEDSIEKFIDRELRKLKA